MKMRALFALIALLFAGAAALWLWPSGGGIVTSRPEAHPIAPSPEPLRTVGVPPSSAAQREPESTPVTATPRPPVRFTSSVMPGQPVARSSPEPVVQSPVARPAANLPSQSASKEPEGQREMEEVRTMFSNYRARLGENPTGTNAEIMKAVMGGNKDRLTLGPPHGQSLNKNGELVDPWGTPYFFHQLSKDSMEIRSAGPDRMMWTPDDLVTK